MAAPLHAIVKTLFLGLEELAPISADEQKVTVLRAMVTSELSDYAQSRTWRFEQSFAPYADALTHAGYPVSSARVPATGDCQRVLYVATRFAEENLANFARAWHMLAAGGMLIAAQHNDLGAKRLESTLKKLGVEVQSLSKHHCRAVAIRKPEAVDAKTEALLAEWAQADAVQNVADTPLLAAPGMFSWRKPDAGSQLLVEALPKSLSGRGADIAAGWGYLSWAALQKCPNIAHITLYEAEKHALDLAEKNLAAHAERCRFVWCDAAKPLDVQGQPLDWAIMNPPAHDMLWSAPEASAAMFACAAQALKAGGKLWLVANRHLPYERTLESLFGNVLIIRETGDFKVIEAVK